MRIRLIKKDGDEILMACRNVNIDIKKNMEMAIETMSWIVSAEDLHDFFNNEEIKIEHIEENVMIVHVPISIWICDYARVEIDNNTLIK